jgi:hypothetical protein
LASADKEREIVPTGIAGYSHVVLIWFVIGWMNTRRSSLPKSAQLYLDLTNLQ